VVVVVAGIARHYGENAGKEQDCEDDDHCQGLSVLIPCDKHKSFIVLY
jgi:hypothetical protein